MSMYCGQHLSVSVHTLAVCSSENSKQQDRTSTGHPMCVCLNYGSMFVCASACVISCCVVFCVSVCVSDYLSVHMSGYGPGCGVVL